MQIEFEKTTNAILFRMVRDGQLFVSRGHLYQKSCDSPGEAWEICNRNGEAEGLIDHFEENELIDKILPIIKHIKF